MWSQDEANFYRDNPLVFVDSMLVRVDKGEEPVRWGDVKIEHQDLFTQAVFDPEKRICAWKGARGCAKSLLCACLIPLHGLIFCKDATYQAVHISVSREGSQEAIKRMRDVLRDNPTIASNIELQRNRAFNRFHPENELLILSSEHASLFPFVPDLCHLDEVDKDESRDLYDTAVSALPKKAGSTLVWTGNAYRSGTWQIENLENLEKEAKKKDSQVFALRTSVKDMPWRMNDPAMKLAEKNMNPMAFRRLWLNEDTGTVGDLLSWDVIQGAIDNNLPQRQLFPMSGEYYAVGVDIGIMRDATAIVLLAVPWTMTEPMRIAAIDLWIPLRGKTPKPVNLNEVEAKLRDYLQKFPVKHMLFDQHQAIKIAQSLQSVPPWVDLVNHKQISVQTYQQMAGLIRNSIESGGLLFNENTGRVFDPKSKGYYTLAEDLDGLAEDCKVDPPQMVCSRNGSFHSDMSVALGLALIAASNIPRIPGDIKPLNKQVKLGSSIPEGGEKRSVAAMLSEHHVW